MEMSNVYVYPELTFKSKRQQQAYTRLVKNVKKVLPIAKQVRQIIIETAEFTETLPPSERDAHLKKVEQYTSTSLPLAAFRIAEFSQVSPASRGISKPPKVTIVAPNERCLS